MKQTWHFSINVNTLSRHKVHASDSTTKQLIPGKTDSNFLSQFRSQKQPRSFPTEYTAIPKEA